MLAFVNAVESGAIGMRSNHEQNSRLLLQLEPASDIVFDRLNCDSEGWSSEESSDNIEDFVEDTDSVEELM